MSEKLRVREVIVVEGKYDEIKLNSVLDALIFKTRGFGIFKDKELLDLLKRLAKERGLIVLTDSDSAGFVIRDYLSGAVSPSRIKHAYIPQFAGREKRKSRPSKEGLLGVEGVDCSVIVDALRKAGATVESEPRQEKDGPPLTKYDLYEAGLTGKRQSAKKREMLLSLMGLPKTLSANRMLAVLNATMTRQEFDSVMRRFDDT